MNHVEFGLAESAAATCHTAWDRWIDKAKKLAGHDLDGDQREDGYSLDGAYDAFCDGHTPEQYVASITA